MPLSSIMELQHMQSDIYFTSNSLLLLSNFQILFILWYTYRVKQGCETQGTVGKGNYALNIRAVQIRLSPGDSSNPQIKPLVIQSPLKHSVFISVLEGQCR